MIWPFLLTSLKNSLLPTLSRRTVPAAIARGYKKAISKMVDICQEKIKGYKFDLGFVHCGAENICKEIAEKFKNIKGCDKIIIRCVSPALSVHVGVGLVGMVVKRKGLI